MLKEITDSYIHYPVQYIATRVLEDPKEIPLVFLF